MSTPQPPTNDVPTVEPELLPEEVLTQWESDIRLAKSRRFFPERERDIRRLVEAIHAIRKLKLEKVRIVESQSQDFLEVQHDIKKRYNQRYAGLVNILNSYFDFNDDSSTESDLIAPEDVWRLHRDLKSFFEEEGQDEVT